MQPFVRRWLGERRPKQYCAFDGQRTMLEHALERASRAVGAERVLCVINEDHRPYLRSPRPIEVPGRLLVQPLRRDTGPGVFLPLAAALASDPEAVVAVLPSDHCIRPVEGFLLVLEEAFALAECLPGYLIMLAAEPDAPEPDYGWIEPGLPLYGSRASLARRFKEKPCPREAERLYRQGCLWNTMMVVAGAAGLWELGRTLCPEMMIHFRELLPRLGTDDEESAIAAAYRDMPSVNFSRHILERACDWTVVLPMTGVRWSDWGRPERVCRDIPLPVPLLGEAKVLHAPS
ncbi:MAG: hypothetical protein KGK30_03105 [Elusimicrobia bacterium]|nr:hypothetical protein [Elusimicrobiota bacterium]